MLLCTEQGLAFQGQTEQDSFNNVEAKSDNERTMQRGNILAVVNSFATLDVVLKEHLEKGAKNAKMEYLQHVVKHLELNSNSERATFS